MKAYLLLACTLVFAAGAALAEEAAKPLRVLLVCGGCCHDYEAQKKILSEGITARANVEFTIVHEGIPSAGKDARDVRVSIYEKPDWWKGYDLVVHDECFGMVSDVAFVEGIAAAHKAGVPAVMLHCSTHSYRAAKTEEWHLALGITSHNHEKKADLDVKVVDAANPVMKGFPAEWPDAEDELYKNEKVETTVTPLAKAYGVETKQDHIVIWLNTYGNARIFCTTLGHSNSTVSSPVYLDLVTRGLLWACDKLTPEGTPKPGYGPAGSDAARCAPVISPDSLLPHLSEPLYIHAETADWIVVEKPPFLPIHPSKPQDAHTLWHRVRDLLAFELVCGGQVSIINCLDRETSGLVLIAKSRASARAFCQAMERREMRKAYLALVWGHPPSDVWEVDAPLLRQGDRTPSPIYLKQMIHPEGAPSRTRFRVERRFRRAGEPFSIVRAEPVTGRMHQIRIHLTHSGNPVVGDKIYGPSETCYLEFIETGWTASLAARLLLPRHALHSAELSPDPSHTWHSPLPPDLHDFASGEPPRAPAEKFSGDSPFAEDDSS